MTKFKILALGALALALCAATAQAEPTADAVAPLNENVATEVAPEAQPALEVDENCPVHGTHAKPTDDLTFEATIAPTQMSSNADRGNDDHQTEAWCYITNSTCESCSGNKIRACTYRRCYCSCSGQWYTTKSCIPCGSFC